MVLFHLDLLKWCCSQPGWLITQVHHSEETLEGTASPPCLSGTNICFARCGPPALVIPSFFCLIKKLSLTKDNFRCIISNRNSVHQKCIFLFLSHWIILQKNSQPENDFNLLPDVYIYLFTGARRKLSYVKWYTCTHSWTDHFRTKAD